MNFIIVGGVPRSGTSLVQKIMDLHPEIYGGPEFDHLFRIARLYQLMSEGVENGRISSYFNQADLKKYFENYVNDLFANVSDTNIKYISEKSPGNALAVNEIISMLPDSKFIIILRNPKAIIASVKKVNKRSSQKIVPGKYLLRELYFIDKYFNCIKKTIDNPKVHMVYYEDLVREPEDHVKDICRFLNIRFHSEMLNTEKKNKTSELIASGNVTLSAWYTSEEFDRKIQDTEIDKWKDALSVNEIRFINYFFSRNRYDFIDRYFDHQKVNMVNTMLGHLSIIDKYTFKKVLRKLVDIST